MACSRLNVPLSLSAATGSPHAFPAVLQPGSNFQKAAGETFPAFHALLSQAVFTLPRQTRKSGRL